MPLLSWVDVAQVLVPLIVGFLLAELTGYLARRRHMVEEFLRRASSVDAAVGAAVSSLRGGPPAADAPRDAQWYLGETKAVLGLVSLRARGAAGQAEHVVKNLEAAVNAVHARDPDAASAAIADARSAQSGFVRAARVPW